MINIKKETMNQIKIIFNIIRECVRFMFYNLVHNASIKTDNNIHKMQYTLLRENHIIEKGMSMKNPRKGFGQEKVMKLIIRLGKYFEYYGKEDPQFLNYPLSTINNYISYTKDCGVDISYIEKMYYDLISNIELNGIKLQLEDPAGIELLQMNLFSEI